MRNTTRMVLLTLVLALAAPSAFAKAKVSVAGAADYYGLMDWGGGLKGGLGFGGGLLMEFPMGKSTGFELGGIFVQRKPFDGGVSTWKTLNVPGAFRFAMSSKFSLHLGGFYEKYLEDGAGNDYGATAGFRLNIPTSSGAFFIEPRYNHGLKTSDSGLNSKTILGLVGFTFGR